MACSPESLRRIISIAPMMAYTDRHFRMLMRQMTRHTVLYTEMVTAQAIIHGDRQRLLGYDPAEHPLALQVGGSDPQLLARCARIAEDYGYAEINLNVGCPSDRVQNGYFGACLMKDPARVAACIEAMRAVVAIPITVKTRLGVDELESYPYFHNFIQQCHQAGCETFIIHARKAWLSGLSPAENREIPPLRYEWVYQLKRDMPYCEVIINGGIKTLEEAKQHLAYVDGVMIGRAAWSNPAMFAEVDQQFYGVTRPLLTERQIIEAYLPYVRQQLANGVAMRHLTSQLLGFFHGRQGARHWRRYLTEQSAGKKAASASDKVIIEALEHVS